MQSSRFGGLVVAAALFGGCTGNGGPLPPAAPARSAPPAPAVGTAVVPVDAEVVSRDDDRGGVPMFSWLSNRPGIRGLMTGIAPAQVAWGTLRSIAPSYRLTDQALAVATLDRVHDTGVGTVIAQFSQHVQGREVFGTRLGVALARDNQPIAVSGSLSSAVAPLAGKSYALDARGAIAAAYEAMTASRLDGAAVSSQGLRGGGYETHDLAVTGGGHARTKAVWFPQSKGLEPAWYVELDLGHLSQQTSSLFSFVVSGHDGKILFLHDMVAYDAFSYRVFADNGGPLGFAPSDSPFGPTPTPHPTGTPSDTQSTFPFVATSLVTLQNVPFSKNDPWLPAGATELKGNNVFAYADLADPDGFSAGTADLNVPTTATGTFDRTFNPTVAANVNSEQIRAGATHLFYNINYLHDFFYDPGYDEASGNAQGDNFGRGGVAGDPVLAEAQDFSGTDNANAATPADGASPRIQMYRWTTAPGRDGDVDTTIISHEWGHTLSNRLIGNGGGLANNQGGGLGEGWADFNALLTITRASDINVAANANWNGTYGLAGYSIGGATGAQYFGLRRYPYSTDMTKNPLTFKHIQANATLPAGPPRRNTGGNGAEVHNTGEVWAQMLWECYAALLKVPGRTFNDANERMRRYYIAGLKLTPSSPTFTEARDGLLAAIAGADQADFQLCAAGFAKRGIGVGAISPPRTATNNQPVTESFVNGGDLQLVSVTLDDGSKNCDSDGILDNNETAKLVVRVRNVGTSTLTRTTGTATSTAASVSFANGGALTFPSSLPWQTVEASLDVSLAGASGSIPITINVGVTDAGLARPRTLTSALTALANTDYDLGTSTTDSVDGPTAWTLDSDPALDQSAPFAKQGTADGGQQWLWPDVAPTSDMRLVSPPLNVGTGAFSISFKNRWQFEAGGGFNFDGSVIELSQDGGATWTDLDTSITVNGYNGSITSDAMPGTPGNNPLLGRRGFIGSRTPAVTTTINLGTTYAGKTVKIRFRGATDQGGGNVGWELDDIAVTGITNKPFATRIADRQTCANRAPTANAGPDQSVFEGTLVQLAGEGSDPDNDPLTFAWTQVSGPAVALSSTTDPKATFTAPLVTGTAVVTLQLVANDGKLDSAPSTVNITIGKVPVGPDMATPIPVPDMSTPLPVPDMSTPIPVPDMSTPIPVPDMSTPIPVPDMTTPIPVPDLAGGPPDLAGGGPGDLSTPADSGAPADGGSTTDGGAKDGGTDGGGSPDMAHGGGGGGGCSCDVSQRGASPNGALFMSVLMMLGFAFRRRLPAILFFLKR